MKAKNFFRASRELIGATRLYVLPPAAFTKSRTSDGCAPTPLHGGVGVWVSDYLPSDTEGRYALC